jgi:hypothetical protein
MQQTRKVYEPSVDGLNSNVVTMIDAIHRSGEHIELYVRRNSWGNLTVFRFDHTEPAWEIWCHNKPPYFCDYKAKIIPVVHGTVHWGSSHTYEPHILSSPGTFAYTPIRRPAWWQCNRPSGPILPIA